MQIFLVDPKITSHLPTQIDIYDKNITYLAQVIAVLHTLPKSLKFKFIIQSELDSQIIQRDAACRELTVRENISYPFGP